MPAALCCSRATQPSFFGSKRACVRRVRGPSFGGQRRLPNCSTLRLIVVGVATTIAVVAFVGCRFTYLPGGFVLLRDWVKVVFSLRGVGARGCGADGRRSPIICLSRGGVLGEAGLNGAPEWEESAAVAEFTDAVGREAPAPGVTYASPRFLFPIVRL